MFCCILCVFCRQVEEYLNNVLAINEQLVHKFGVDVASKRAPAKTTKKKVTAPKSAKTHLRPASGVHACVLSQ